ncbi:hypothetical protein L873DRAFT_62779 [Choiromyces venosus 120613-1]|uniref:Mid2 domain-containing protein n=1 Tax=Choiromyces venosus 120613-1 TaxID=1336337 RepID=A0A3N4JHW3_9PEZI|nr:hypothetical protein L873DRAFT_62779 [Choiromyces venosus 120613-1]
MEFVRGPCPNGYNWYVCAQFGYLGCCSKDACSVGGCPPGSEYPIDSPSQISSLGNVGDVQSNAGNSGGSGLGGQQTGSPSTTVKISPATPTTSSTATRLLSSGTTTAVIQPSLASTSSISVLLITPGSSPSKTTSPEQSAVGTGTGSGAASATTSGLSSGTGSGSNSDSNSNNTNSIPLVVIIGAAIGGALLILIIILAVILFRRRRRKAKNPPQVPPIYGSGPAPLPNDGAIKGMSNSTPSIKSPLTQATHSGEKRLPSLFQTHPPDLRRKSYNSAICLSINNIHRTSLTRFPTIFAAQYSHTQLRRTRLAPNVLSI